MGEKDKAGFNPASGLVVNRVRLVGDAQVGWGGKGDSASSNGYWVSR